MAKIIHFKKNLDKRGALIAIEELKEVPFEIKRIFYIYDLKNDNIIRGGHRHHKTTQCLIALKGSCEIYVNNGTTENNYFLSSPDQGLILEPKDWHTMQEFKDGCILLCIASEFYDPNDYITEKYL